MVEGGRVGGLWEPHASISSRERALVETVVEPWPCLVGHFVPAVSHSAGLGWRLAFAFSRIVTGALFVAAMFVLALLLGVFAGCCAQGELRGALGCVALGLEVAIPAVALLWWTAGARV